MRFLLGRRAGLGYRMSQPHCLVCTYLYRQRTLCTQGIAALMYTRICSHSIDIPRPTLQAVAILRITPASSTTILQKHSLQLSGLGVEDQSQS